MPYAALPDHRIPYDNDGSAVGEGTEFSGVYYWANNATMLNWQDTDLAWNVGLAVDPGPIAWWCFFPEQREVTAYYGLARGDITAHFAFSVKGSNDSTNGLDGTWETASLPGGVAPLDNAYSWRASIKPVSFTGPKRAVRLVCVATPGRTWYVVMVHLYGEKAAGQTPDDIIYIDHDTTPGVEFAASEDFGDRPLGTTVTRQFRLKNTSSTKTANTINIQCNDTDFVLSTDGTTWVVTINVASLAAGAESPTYYVRNTTPAAGNQVGPRFARIVTIVGSWT